MKTEMTTDEFAQFIAKMIIRIDHYEYDVLYDVSRIMAEHQKYRGDHEAPIYTTYHFMHRCTGSDMVDPSDENYKLFAERNDKIYSLQFCWNRDYFNVPFCIMETIK